MDRMTGTVLNELKNQKNDIFTEQFSFSGTPPSSCLIEVSTNDLALTSFVLNLSRLLVGGVLPIVQ